VLEEWKNKLAQFYNQNENVNHFDDWFYREPTHIVYNMKWTVSIITKFINKWKYNV